MADVFVYSHWPGMSFPAPTLDNVDSLFAQVLALCFYLDHAEVEDQDSASGRLQMRKETKMLSKIILLLLTINVTRKQSIKDHTLITALRQGWTVCSCQTPPLISIMIIILLDQFHAYLHKFVTSLSTSPLSLCPLIL